MFYCVYVIRLVCILCFFYPLNQIPYCHPACTNTKPSTSNELFDPYQVLTFVKESYSTVLFLLALNRIKKANSPTKPQKMFAVKENQTTFWNINPHTVTSISRRRVNRWQSNPAQEHMSRSTFVERKIRWLVPKKVMYSQGRDIGQTLNAWANPSPVRRLQKIKFNIYLMLLKKPSK